MSASPSPSTVYPSFPNSFTSKFYIEITGWDAHLKVDHDGPNPFSLRRLRAARSALLRVGPVKTITVYKTTKGHHIRIWFAPLVKRLSAATALRLQALLGDDPKRQKFNARRVRRREVGWNILWNSKTRNGRVEMLERVDAELTQIARKVFEL